MILLLQFTDYDTANEDQNEGNRSDQGNVESDVKGKPESECDKTAPQVTITTAPDTSNGDEVEGSRPSTSQVQTVYLASFKVFD